MEIYSAFGEAILVYQTHHVAATLQARNIHVNRLVQRVKRRVANVNAICAYDIICSFLINED